MRETYRSEDNKTYWTKRWDSIDADEIMENTEKYPLKYTLEAISLKNENQKILEAGCGAGRILSYLYNKNYNVVGIEFIDSAVKKIKIKNPEQQVYTMDILKTTFNDEEFDTILAFGLYHNFQLENFKKSLIETKRILKNDGIYSSLSDQNKLYLESISSKYRFSYQELRQLSVISADFSMWKSKSVRDCMIDIESENRDASKIKHKFFTC